MGQEDEGSEVKDADLFEMTQAEAAQHKLRDPPKNAVSVGKIPVP